MTSLMLSIDGTFLIILVESTLIVWVLINEDKI